MTQISKAKIVELRLAGWTNREIIDAFQVSKTKVTSAAQHLNLPRSTPTTKKIILVPHTLDDNERWIVGGKNRYFITDAGRVFTCIWRKEEMGQRLSHKGYPLVLLAITKGKSKNCTVHRQVALAFIPNPLNKPQVNHINGIKTDNNVSNLEWCTGQENMSHAYLHKLTTNDAGENHWKASIDEYTALRIIDLIKTTTLPLKEISLITGASKCTVADISAGKSWKHLIAYGKSPGSFRNARFNSSKLNTAQVIELRRLAKEEKTPVKTLAAQFSICKTNVKQIIDGVTWKDCL